MDGVFLTLILPPSFLPPLPPPLLPPLRLPLFVKIVNLLMGNIVTSDDTHHLKEGGEGRGGEGRGGEGRGGEGRGGEGGASEPR